MKFFLHANKKWIAKKLAMMMMDLFFIPFLSAAKASQTSSLQLQSEAAKNGS